MDDDTSPGPLGLGVRVVAGFALDAWTNGAVLLSVIVFVAGLVDHGAGAIVLGSVVGILGVLAPWTALARGWSDQRQVVVDLAVTLVDALALLIIVHG